MQVAERRWAVMLAEGWANRWALHALPFFDSAPDEATRNRRNALWNAGYLAVQALALASYAWTRHDERLRAVSVLAFGLGFYGWLDLTLCILRKALLLKPTLTGASASDHAGRLTSTWLLFVSLAVVYANGFCALGLRFRDQFAGAGMDGPAAAFALSAATITTVGSGASSPVGAAAAALAFMEALSGLALLACVVAGMIARALSRPEYDEISAYMAPISPVRPYPRLVPGAITATIVLYGMLVGLLILGL